MRKDFSLTPSVRFNRSKFTMPHGVKNSMTVGKLTPISIMEVLPGDSIKSTMSCVARVSSSFIKPVMDNLYMDVYHFFVPLRLCYDKLEEVFGKASPSMYDDGELEEIPTFNSSVTISPKSVGDYLGLPLGTIPKGLSVLPFRAFAKIYNDWFRNENITDEVYIQKGDINSETPNNLPWSSSNYTGLLPSVGKKKDYFTSCLLKTQKGQVVSVPLGDMAPVKSSPYLSEGLGRTDPLYAMQFNGSGFVPASPLDSDNKYVAIGFNNSTDGMLAGRGDTKDGLGLRATPYYFNMWADLKEGVAMTNVNDLRFMFQLQKMLERDALYGSRYNEYLLGHFGVSSPDSRLQFSEYLGGGRIPIGVQQVEQTSQATDESPLGNVAGFSLSNGFSKFSKGFVEHGYVITVACIRTIHSYQQGVSKLFSRKSRNDFYDPLFANLGEQPVYKSELFANVGTELRDKNQIFGYNEAFAEYRYLPSTITGEMRSASPNSLDIWHFADKYNNAPTLTDDFILENPKNIDRTLSVPSTSMDNFICDFYFNTEAIRVMPTYSVPGLIDHH